ncbi:unnamed protein product [Closterium sp. NIES-53]
MALLRVLAFDHEGRPVQFDTWLVDLQLYLLSNSKDSVSLFDLASGIAPAPPAIADSATRSQWLTRDAAARLAIRNHLPLAESFTTVEDLVSHLRTSDARYRATVPAEFLDRNQPPMFITLYFKVTRLPDSLRSVRDHFLSLDPTSLTVDLLEQHLLAAVGVAAVAAVGLVAVGLALGVEVLEVATVSSSSVEARPSRPSSFDDLLRSRIAIFELDFDVTLSVCAEGDCYQCVPPDPGIAAAALGATEYGTLPGIAPSQALHTFTLDSGASRCFFCDSTTLTPLLAPVPVKLADPSGSPLVALSSTLLVCPAVPSGSLSGLHLPSFSTNSVSTTALQDVMVTTTTPRGQEAASCSCRLLSHQTLLWHNLLGHPSLPRLRGMHSRLLVSGLPRSLPPLPPSPAPPCLPCVQGRQRAAPHSSFPPTTAPLQTLHMDVWGPARVSGLSRKCYFLLVVDGYKRYTTVFPMRSKGQVVDVLIPWIHTVHLQLRERFGQDLPVPHLHSKRGGEFSSNLLRDFCRGEGILQSFTLLDSPQQNGIAKCCIGLVMEVARTSMIHAAAPNFLWPFAVQYAAHQLNLWFRVSLMETSPTLHWTGKVGVCMNEE